MDWPHDNRSMKAREVYNPRAFLTKRPYAVFRFIHRHCGVGSIHLISQDSRALLLEILTKPSEFSSG
jgi:hypothetical protein